MLRYTVRRIPTALLVLFIASIVIFLLLTLLYVAVKIVKKRKPAVGS